MESNPVRTTSTLFYAAENRPGNNGTEFVTHKRLRGNVLEFKRVNERISYKTLKNAIANITIANIYAPTQETQDLDKDEFYEQLEEMCEMSKSTTY